MVLSLMALAVTPGVELRTTVDGGKPASGWVYARAGQRIVLEAVAPPGVVEVHWFKVEPTVESLDNTQPSFHFEPVSYRETELGDCTGQLSCPVDVAATVPPAVPELPGAGTMAFKVRVRLKDGRELSTPGKEAVQYGGLTKAVHRVTLRAGDGLLGYAAELINTPYIFGSAGPDGRNQSDLLIGSDCADFIVYARRRMGKSATYTSSYQLDQQARPLAGVPCGWSRTSRPRSSAGWLQEGAPVRRFLPPLLRGDPGEDVAGVGEEALAVTREAHAARLAHQEQSAELVLQRAELPARGRLGHVEPLGGAGDAPPSSPLGPTRSSGPWWCAPRHWVHSADRVGRWPSQACIVELAHRVSVGVEDAASTSRNRRRHGHDEGRVAGKAQHCGEARG